MKSSNISVNKVNLRARELFFSAMAFSLFVTSLQAKEEAEVRAEAAQKVLWDDFWDARERLFQNSSEHDKNDKQFHYWWQAQALDVLIDQYERSGKVEDLEKAQNLANGLVHRNGGLTNDYRDDMLWYALALLRLHDHAPDIEIRRAINTLWNSVKEGWNDKHGGGIGWRVQQPDYKALPANAPAVILTARLYKRFGRKEDLAWALKIQKWMDDTLIDPESGFVWDGINRQGRGRVDRHWRFTYNQGTVIGANLALFEATEDKKWLGKAHRTADAAMNHWAKASDGMITETGRKDGALFKGIFVRYLGELIADDPKASTPYRELLQKNADSLWNGADGEKSALFDNDWENAKPVKSTELSAQLSAVMLFEMVAHSAKSDGN